ncbi:gag-pol fusion protein-like protein [Leptotrombidium deliense]|uniref:Gag-pol fusion protein-like protein n=1 Tax=Leptotrombidium deliense TaxID=299467 RepID=A0A443S8N8_9ACAR|nr:gag-pol fusion protein-like protein [Leptotrombidium deliense]
MFKDIVNWVTSCPVCQQVKSFKHKSAELLPIEPGKRPFSQIGLDIIGMLPATSRGNRFIIVVTCYLTKFVVTQTTKNVTAKIVADFLMQEIILKYSAFEVLISDNGVQFRSELFEQLNKLLGSKHRFTTPYKPSTAGLVERTNRFVMQLIKSYVQKDPLEWDIVLPYITHIYNISFHSALNTSPFYLTRGYVPKLPVDQCLNLNNETVQNPGDYIYEVAINLQKAREEAKEHILNAQEKYKELFDKTHTNYEFNVGEKCYVNYPIRKIGESNKFKNKWLGPFTIIHKINSRVYEVESDDRRFYFDRININKMRPCVTRKSFEPSTCVEKSRSETINPRPTIDQNSEIPFVLLHIQ